MLSRIGSTLRHRFENIDFLALIYFFKIIPMRSTSSFWRVLIFGFFALTVPVFAIAQSTYLSGSERSGLPDAPIYLIVYSTMMWLLAVVGFLAIIGFVISGILYLTSAGNDKQVATAKAAMTASIMGVIVALLGYVVVFAVNGWLNASTSF